MISNEKPIVVVGATGQQGGAVVRALQGSNQFKGRALSRSPDKHRELADEVVKADLNCPETLKARALFHRGCLWNTCVTVGRASTFVDLLCSQVPEVILSINEALAENEPEATTAGELFDKMLEFYPDRINPGALWSSARGAKP
jgi:NmrA-like family